MTFGFERLVAMIKVLFATANQESIRYVAPASHVHVRGDAVRWHDRRIVTIAQSNGPEIVVNKKM